MKRIIGIALFFALSLGACSNDDENSKVNDYDELPVWLISQAKNMAESFKNYDGDPSLLYSISCTTGIHGETVYRVYRAYDSCLFCNLYDENGNHVDYTDVFGEIKEGDVIGGEGWIIIFPKKK